MFSSLRSPLRLLPVIAMVWLLGGASFCPASTIEGRLHQYGAAVQDRLKPLFVQAGIKYPPARVAFVVLKTENQLQIYAGGPVVPGQKLPYTFITSVPILSANGPVGPKLHEKDGQVPEGIYEVDNLDPSGRLALHVNFPNKEDRLHAKDDGRKDLSGNILIHGQGYQASTGSVEVADDVAQNLFILSAQARPGKTLVIFAPYDLRTGSFVPPDSTQNSPQIPWLHGLYERIGVRWSNFQYREPNTYDYAPRDCKTGADW